MREKLIELIENAPVWKSASFDEACKQVADHLIANGVTVQRWIPVTERLPKDRGDVLVVCYWHEKWQVKMGWCAPERKKWSVHVGFADRDDITVTHWMPLPTPPKDGE